jgi:hypothetical protein
VLRWPVLVMAIVAMSPGTPQIFTPPAGAKTAGGATTHDGVWQVVASESFVGYRVREKLTFLPAPSDAVGRTSAVVGSVVVSGRRITSTKVATDLRTLKSGSARRDRCVVRHLGRYPRASLRLVSALTIPAVPDGKVFRISAPATCMCAA